MANSGGVGGTSTTSDASFAGAGGTSAGTGAPGGAGSGGGEPDGSADVDAGPNETGRDVRPDTGDEASRDPSDVTDDGRSSGADLKIVTFNIRYANPGDGPTPGTGAIRRTIIRLLRPSTLPAGTERRLRR
jgi:hypothetical protein